jgi:hypothetical protein
MSEMVALTINIKGELRFRVLPGLGAYGNAQKFALEETLPELFSVVESCGCRRLT